MDSKTAKMQKPDTTDLFGCEKGSECRLCISNRPRVIDTWKRSLFNMCQKKQYRLQRNDDSTNGPPMIDYKDSSDCKIDVLGLSQ